MTVTAPPRIRRHEHDVTESERRESLPVPSRHEVGRRQESRWAVDNTGHNPPPAAPAVLAVIATAAPISATTSRSQQPQRCQ